jgi:hypothetical protein
LTRDSPLIFRALSWGNVNRQLTPKELTALADISKLTRISVDRLNNAANYLAGIGDEKRVLDSLNMQSLLEAGSVYKGAVVVAA